MACKMTRIESLRGAFRGETVSLLATGPSATELRYRDLPGLVMGLNQSDRLVPSDWHVYGHPLEHWENRYGDQLFSFHGLGGSTVMTMLTPVKFTQPRFSLDLMRGAYQSEAPVLGLQVLAWLEPDEVHIYGMDLKGAQIDVGPGQRCSQR